MRASALHPSTDEWWWRWRRRVISHICEQDHLWLRWALLAAIVSLTDCSGAKVAKNPFGIFDQMQNTFKSNQSISANVCAHLLEAHLDRLTALIFYFSKGPVGTFSFRLMMQWYEKLTFFKFGPEPKRRLLSIPFMVWDFYMHTCLEKRQTQSSSLS